MHCCRDGLWLWLGGARTLFRSAFADAHATEHSIDAAAGCSAHTSSRNNNDENGEAGAEAEVDSALQLAEPIRAPEPDPAPVITAVCVEPRSGELRLLDSDYQVHAFSADNGAAAAAAEAGEQQKQRSPARRQVQTSLTQSVLNDVAAADERALQEELRYIRTPPPRVCKFLK